MGIDLWNHSKFLHHKVRNMTRRGWLLKTYNDRKMLTARVQTGEKIQNDRLDVIHPVGYVAHTPPGDNTEVITMDVGADTSRRVVLAIMGDRDTHPQPDEGEAFLYAPGDKGMFVRVKKAGSQSRDRSGNSDSGRAAGVHIEGKDQAISATSTKSFSVDAKEGINLKTDKHVLEGDVLIKGNLNVEHDLRINGEGYKPSDGLWLAGGVAAASSPISGRATPPLTPPVANLIKFENGNVVIEGDLIVGGNLRVHGTITAKEFVRG